MLSEHRVLQLIQESFDSLRESELIETSVTVAPETVLLGSSSVLDSIAFVTFMAEFEERVQRETGSDESVFALALDDLHAFNPDDALLTAATLSEYVMKMADPKAK
jgi:hypothetical protein